MKKFEYFFECLYKIGGGLGFIHFLITLFCYSIESPHNALLRSVPTESLMGVIWWGSLEIIVGVIVAQLLHALWFCITPVDEVWGKSVPICLGYDFFEQKWFKWVAVIGIIYFLMFFLKFGIFSNELYYEVAPIASRSSASAGVIDEGAFAGGVAFFAIFAFAFRFDK